MVTHHLYSRPYVLIFSWANRVPFFYYSNFFRISNYTYLHHALQIVTQHLYSRPTVLIFSWANRVPFFLYSNFFRISNYTYLHYALQMVTHHSYSRPCVLIFHWVRFTINCTCMVFSKKFKIPQRKVTHHIFVAMLINVNNIVYFQHEHHFHRFVGCFGHGQHFRGLFLAWNNCCCNHGGHHPQLRFIGHPWPFRGCCPP